ncbi:T9SS type A sorting domain-containing protein [Winogradskyella aurantiaca]|uniref:T9SS type A sorting domain-containing protein n=1 Tax=Winogradskyella aurantiaca TaxID=2219558 RepID=UPI000E1DFDD1|nr:T9SS type A sorting domain-containing protein [Winogradskyella aurantiaca]
MKKLYITILSLFTTLLSFGQVIVAESFSYPDGSLVPNGGWLNSSGAEGDLLVESGKAVVQHGTPSEDVEITFSAVNGDIYAGFDFSVDDLGAPYSDAGTDFEYFAHFSFRAQMDIVPPTGGGDYSVGISSDDNTAEDVWATDLTYGVTYRAIIRFNQDTGTATLWIDPTMSSDTSITGSPDGAFSVTSFDLRQSDSDENETIRVDDLMIGQTFNDVVTFAEQTDPAINIDSPGDGEVLDSGTTSVDVEFSIDNDPGATVNISVVINGGTPAVSNGVSSPFTINGLSDGDAIDVNVDLVDGGVLDSDSISFSIASVSQVADIAGLRAGVQGNLYQITGEVIVSFVTGNSRNQIFIQDSSGGILIDDNSAIITTAYNTGDGITGLTGELGEFGNVLQLVPSSDPGAPSSTGVSISAQVVSIDDLLNNIDTYESQLVFISDVTFADGNGVNTFSSSTNYDISDSSGGPLIFRTNYPNDNMDGELIPNSPTSITVLAGEFFGTVQVYPRAPNEVLSNDEFEIRDFSIYPNPVENGLVNIVHQGSTELDITVYDILGKEILDTQVSNNQIDVSDLKSGLYILRISDNGNSITKKLVIK